MQSNGNASGSPAGNASSADSELSAEGGLRYSTPEVRQLFGAASQFHLWHLIEAAAAEAQGAPRDAVRLIRAARTPSAQQVAEIERVTRHDVVAFVKALRANVASAAGTENDWALRTQEERERAVRAACAAVHRGLTSSDVVDSANGVRWSTAGQLMAEEMRELARELAAHALEHRSTRRVGRTHGQWAEESCWGKWVADRALMAARARDALALAAREVAQVQMSGPVGDFKRTTEEQEEEFARVLAGRIGLRGRWLRAAPSSLQVIGRDSLMGLMQAAARAAAVCNSVAMEVRLGAQSEIGELAEGFGEGQAGSSSMPHKRNPVGCEQLQGVGELVNNTLGLWLRGVTVWGERDISHSSVERVGVAQTVGLTHYMVRGTRKVVGGLVVNRGRMEENLERARPVLESGAALTWLQGEVEPGAAWRLVKEAADSGGSIGTELPKVYERWVKESRAEAAGWGERPSPNWAEMRQALRAEPKGERVWRLMEELSSS